MRPLQAAPDFMGSRGVSPFPCILANEKIIPSGAKPRDSLL